jgi:hypothetical protein
MLDFQRLCTDMGSVVSGGHRDLNMKLVTFFHERVQ